MTVLRIRHAINFLWDYILSQFQNVPFCPISASPMSGIYASLRQAQILILEILNVWIPVPLFLSGVVEILAFLDLESRCKRETF